MEASTFPNPLLPTFFTMFLLVYMLGYTVVFCNWKRRAEASSCLTSLAHGTPAVVMSLHVIYSSQASHTMASPNATLQNAVLDFSVAYFLVDLLHYIMFQPNDVLFISHHVATLYVLLTCRYVVCYGASEVLIVLVLAEVTSACQNIWSLARLRKSDQVAAAKVYEMLCVPFYVFYSIVRGILGPLFVHKMGVSYSSGAAEGLIPKWAWISWMVVIVSGIILSVLWVSNLWAVRFREKVYRVQVKNR